MGEEVGGHEGAVAVAHDGDAVWRRRRRGGAVVDGGFGASDELLDVGVVGLLKTHTSRDARHPSKGVAVTKLCPTNTDNAVF